MGLSELEAKVVRALLVEEELTLTALTAEVRSNRPAVSTAVSSLMRRGLVERVTTRRPGVVFLHPDAEETFARLRAAALAREQDRAEAVEDLREQLEAAVAKRLDRGRPHYELMPTRRGYDSWPSRDRGRTSHDEVLLADEVLRWGCGRRALLGCPTRVLISGEGVDLVACSARQPPGSEVRDISEALPALKILNGERVGLAVTYREGSATGWTRDGRHVRAVQELFELWWDRAGPGATAPSPPEWDESLFDVDL